MNNEIKVTNGQQHQEKSNQNSDNTHTTKSNLRKKGIIAILQGIGAALIGTFLTFKFDTSEGLLLGLIGVFGSFACLGGILMVILGILQLLTGKNILKFLEDKDKDKKVN